MIKVWLAKICFKVVPLADVTEEKSFCGWGVSRLLPHPPGLDACKAKSFYVISHNMQRILVEKSNLCIFKKKV